MIYKREQTIPAMQELIDHLKECEHGDECSVNVELGKWMREMARQAMLEDAMEELLKNVKLRRIATSDSISIFELMKARGDADEKD